MKQALKDLILSEHPEDNALAVAILKQKTWRIFRGIIPIIIKRFMIFNIGDTKEFLRINDAYWEPYTTKNGGGASWKI